MHFSTRNTPSLLACIKRNIFALFRSFSSLSKVRRKKAEKKSINNRKKLFDENVPAKELNFVVKKDQMQLNMKQAMGRNMKIKEGNFGLF